MLISLLSKLKESGAERVFFSPNEPGYAYTADVKRPIGTAVLSARTIVDAIAEVVSHEDLDALPDNRPRIVHHEHGDDTYVLEVVRQASGIALGIRFATQRPVRVPTFRDAANESSKEAPKPPPKEADLAEPPEEKKAPAIRAAKRTVRVELDEEGNPIDSVALDIDPSVEANVDASLEARHAAATRRLPRPDPRAATHPGPQSSRKPTPGPASSADRMLQTMLRLDPLADLPRTGWLLRGVRPCESIADHSFGVAVLAMLFVDAIRARGGTIDGERTLRMALVHDAAEAKTGDVPMPNKTPRMSEALHELEETLVRELLPAAACEAWAEAERGDSLEARVVKAADKAQMMIKVLSYERQRRGQLDDFWANPANFDHRGVDVARELFAAVAEAAGRTLP